MLPLPGGDGLLSEEEMSDWLLDERVLGSGTFFFLVVLAVLVSFFCLKVVLVLVFFLYAFFCTEQGGLSVHVLHYCCFFVFQRF